MQICRNNKGILKSFLFSKTYWFLKPITEGKHHFFQNRKIVTSNHDRINYDCINHDRINHDRINHDRINHDPINRDRINHDRINHDRYTGICRVGTNIKFLKIRFGAHVPVNYFVFHFSSTGSRSTFEFPSRVILSGPSLCCTQLYGQE